MLDHQDTRESQEETVTTAEMVPKERLVFQAEMEKQAEMARTESQHPLDHQDAKDKRANQVLLVHLAEMAREESKECTVNKENKDSGVKLDQWDHRVNKENPASGSKVTKEMLDDLDRMEEQYPSKEKRVTKDQEERREVKESLDKSDPNVLLKMAHPDLKVNPDLMDSPAAQEKLVCQDFPAEMVRMVFQDRMVPAEEMESQDYPDPTEKREKEENKEEMASAVVKENKAQRERTESVSLECQDLAVRKEQLVRKVTVESPVQSLSKKANRDHQAQLVHLVKMEKTLTSMMLNSDPDSRITSEKTPSDQAERENLVSVSRERLVIQERRVKEVSMAFQVSTESMVQMVKMEDQDHKDQLVNRVNLVAMVSMASLVW